MDKRIQIWNILHDGEITAISGEKSETLTMFVSIPYIRRRLKPLGDSFVLILSGMNQIEFHDFDGKITFLQNEIEIGIPEILCTESESMPITIDTTMGQLILSFQDIKFKLDTGQEITFETIEKVCQDYWTEWKERSEQSQTDASS